MRLLAPHARDRDPEGCGHAGAVDRADPAHSALDSPQTGCPHAHNPSGYFASLFS